jgi:hypothetical protein
VNPEPVNQDHNNHIARLRRAFAEANGRFLARLRGVDDDAAVRAAADGGWSAAQIVWHVASVSSQFARLMSGEVAGARRLADDFRERAWGEIVADIPARLQAPLTARPPAEVTRSEAIALLEASGERMDRALEEVTPDRAERYGIKSSIVGGEINVYQIAEWATAHVIRHNQQAKRTLGR